MKKSPGVFSRCTSALSRVLNHNFCPSFDPYVYWLKQPIGWVVCAAVASLLTGLFVGPQGFVLMWSLLALIVIGFLWPWLAIKTVTAELTFEEQHSTEGVETVALLTVKNKCPLAAYGLTVEGSFLQHVVHQDDLIAVGLEKVPGWSVTTFKWKLTPQQRGRLPVEIPKLSTGFPFGIIKCSKPIIVHQSMIVWPSSGQLKGKPSTFSAHFAPEEIAQITSGKQGEMIGVRDFRQGDSMRHVHWAKTAQQNRLIVKEFQSSAKETVQITLDLSKSSHTGSGGHSSFEWAIRTAATICKQLDQYQFLIQLVCVGLPESEPNTMTNEKGLTPLLDFLALLPSFESLAAETTSAAPVRLESTSPRLRLSFIVCTDRSAISFKVSRHVKRIQIACQLFRPTQEEAEIERDGQHPELESLVLTSPQTAAAELSDGWDSEYSYGI